MTQCSTDATEVRGHLQLEETIHRAAPAARPADTAQEPQCTVSIDRIKWLLVERDAVLVGHYYTDGDREAGVSDATQGDRTPIAIDMLESEE